EAPPRPDGPRLVRGRQGLLQQNLRTIGQLANLRLQLVGLRLIVEVQEQPVVAEAQIDMPRHLPSGTPSVQPGHEGACRTCGQLGPRPRIDAPLGWAQHDPPLLYARQERKARGWAPIE